MKKCLPLLFLMASCSTAKKIQEDPTNHFPVTEEKVTTMPARDKFYIFLMAGQSNMAGRGIVQPDDTISSPRVLALNKNNEWVNAKEPLHYYEPGRTGLDCGLSFGKTLAALYGNDITIGIVPCAIGGSSVEQWLGDSTYRNVTLYSNFRQKATAAMQQGTIKGILWHQGESNATAEGYKDYKKKLIMLFTRMRHDLNQEELPIYTGPLAAFLSRKANPNTRSVNDDIGKVSQELSRVYVIPTGDFTPKPDSIHFDSRSQRLMGKRFAKEVYKHK